MNGLLGGARSDEHQRGSIETWRETTGYLRRMSVDPAFLAKISLFAPLDDDERAVLTQAMVDRQVKPGEVLFRAGEPGDSMFIVVGVAILRTISPTRPHYRSADRYFACFQRARTQPLLLLFKSELTRCWLAAMRFLRAYLLCSSC